jgi:hypothetical protein
MLTTEGRPLDTAADSSGRRDHLSPSKSPTRSASRQGGNHGPDRRWRPFTAVPDGHRTATEPENRATLNAGAARGPLRAGPHAHAISHAYAHADALADRDPSRPIDNTPGPGLPGRPERGRARCASAAPARRPERLRGLLDRGFAQPALRGQRPGQRRGGSRGPGAAAASGAGLAHVGERPDDPRAAGQHRERHRPARTAAGLRRCDEGDDARARPVPSAAEYSRDRHHRLGRRARAADRPDEPARDLRRRRRAAPAQRPRDGARRPRSHAPGPRPQPRAVGLHQLVGGWWLRNLLDARRRFPAGVGPRYPARRVPQRGRDHTGARHQPQPSGTPTPGITATATAAPTPVPERPPSPARTDAEGRAKADPGQRVLRVAIRRTVCPDSRAGGADVFVSA